MLSLVEQRAAGLAGLLDAPGGFAWWYADLIDAQGRGMVLIWSFGLPFLNGSRSRGLPRERPAVCLALYEAERTVCYLLQTYSPDDVTFAGPSHVKMGQSLFRLWFEGGVATLDAQLDLPVIAGGRICGTVQVRGVRCRPHAPAVADDSHLHQWAPIVAASSGRASLAVEGRPFELHGRAYVDSNTSAEPLHALGIRQWRWGRVALPGRELIYYLVDPAHAAAPAIEHVLEVLPNGSVREHAAHAEWSSPRRSLYGLAFWDRVRLRADAFDVDLQFGARVDEGPFYLRFLVHARDATGAEGTGFAEQVAPERVDRPWQRPFVHMRTHHTHAHNSIWLPLFSGPVQGRLKRLLRHWLPARPPLRELS